MSHLRSNRITRAVAMAICCTASCGVAPAQTQPTVAGKPYIIQKGGREATRRAMVKALTGIDVRSGDWYMAAPFPNAGGAKDFGTPAPFEETIIRLKAGETSWDVTREKAFRKVTPRQDIGGLGGVAGWKTQDGLRKRRNIRLADIVNSAVDSDGHGTGVR